MPSSEKSLGYHFSGRLFYHYKINTDEIDTLSSVLWLGQNVFPAESPKGVLLLPVSVLFLVHVQHPIS